MPNLSTATMTYASMSTYGVTPLSYGQAQMLQQQVFASWVTSSLGTSATASYIIPISYIGTSSSYTTGNTAISNAIWNTASWQNAVHMKEHNDLNSDDMTYLRAMPKLIRFSNWIVVHAGFECEGTPPDKQSRDTVCRVRDVDINGKMAADHKNPLNPVPGAVPWTLQWQGPENVVYGHAVHSRTAPRVDEHKDYSCYGIDTGCVFGGKLTAMVLNPSMELEFAQVQAKREYHPWANRNKTND